MPAKPTSTRSWRGHPTNGRAASAASSSRAKPPAFARGRPNTRWACSGSPTGQLHLSEVEVDADRLIGAEGQGFTIALAALDTGRLGIAACAVGLAQAALDVALDYAGQRRQFGHSIADFEGMGFLLADMATGIEAARAMYLAAARRADAG